MSDTETSGVANFSENRSSRANQLIPVLPASDLTSSLQRLHIGFSGWSLMSQFSITGIKGSNKFTNSLMILDLACPLSPKSIMSWPDNIAVCI